MHRLYKSSAILAFLAVLAFACGGSLPGGDKVPGADKVPGSDKVPAGAALPSDGKVDPNACGGMSMNDATKNLKAFLQASLALNDALLATAEDLKSTCAKMGTELGMTDLDGKPEDVCPKVVAEIQNNLKVGLKAGAKLTVKIQPAVCEVNVDAAASAAASCSGSASADVGVTCGGTCNGECAGECTGKTGKGGKCAGTCKGECKGSCDGHADVQAEASCEAQAEVKANVDAKCTPPEVDITFKAKVVKDKAKVDKAVAALKAGLPAILRVKAMIGTPEHPGPLLGTAMTTASSAKALVKSVGGLKDALKDQFLCVSGQLKAAADLAASIAGSFEVEANITVEVSASASVSGEAG